MIQTVFSVTLPIYLGIALGYVATRMGWFQPEMIRTLGRYTVLIGMPAMLFRGLSHQSVSAIFNPDYLAVYTLGSFTAMGINFAFARKLRGNPVSLSALQSLGSSSSNSFFVGYPIATMVLGPTATVAVALCMLVENILVLPVALALIDSGQAGSHNSARHVMASTLKSISRNPMIWAIAVGLGFSVLGLRMPSALETTIGLFAGSTSAIALFVIGGSLVGLHLTGMRKDISLVVIGKLVLHPLCVFFWVWLFPPTEPLLRAAAVLFAAMPMMSVYPALGQRYGFEKLCAAALLGATVASFFTITTAIALLPEAWLHATH